MLLPVTAIIAQRTSQIMLGFWYDAHELGLYAGAAKLSEALFILSSGVQIVLLPVVAGLHARGDQEGLRRAVLEAERWVSMLLWPAVAFIILAARPVVHILLSDEFLAAAPILIILSVHALLASLRAPLQTKAMGLGEFRFAGRVALAAMLTVVALNLVLIPESIGGVTLAGLGARGAAFASLGSGVVTLLAYRRKAHEWTGHPLFSVHLLRHAGAALATMAALTLAAPWLGLPPLAATRVWHLALYALLVLASYSTILAAVGELRGSDLRLARAAFASQTAKSR
jgi:O-antigen/teichoic acid export membrane protein